MDYQTQSSGRTTRRSRGIKPAGIIAIVILVVIVLIVMVAPPFVMVPSGHTGIVLTFGRVADYTLEPGFHMKSPVQNIILMDHRVQKAQISLDAFSSDIQQVDVVVSVIYSVKTPSAQTLYQNVGTNYYEKVMEPRILECVKAVFTRYTAEKLMQVRDTLSVQVRELLAPEMDEYGIDVSSVAIENVDFTDAFTNAVEDKQVAEQTKLRVETEQAQQISVERATAERQLIAADAQAKEKQILAQAEAEVEKIKADAQAYAVEVQAEAEAQANEKLAKSITKELIEYVQANGWDGVLPQFVGGDQMLPILDLREGTAAPEAE